MAKIESIPYVKKQLGETYLVWLQNSNSYFLLEGPAWFVFDKITGNHAPQIIEKELVSQYEMTAEESRTFLNDMAERIKSFNEMVPMDHDLGFEQDLVDYEFLAFSQYTYLLKDKLVRFRYSGPELERYIHPLVEHLVVEDGDCEEVLDFELFAYDGEVVFRMNGKVMGVWAADESHWVKGRIFLEFVNVLHDKIEQDWLMTVHASAITNKKKTVLFSAAPGSGKTTMAALLQARGYHLISDDFVPVDKAMFKAHPFPIAMSVKEGALSVLKSHYPALAETPVVNATPEKKVRYWPIRNDKMEMVFPVNEILFINYDESADCELISLSKADAMKRLVDQVWVPPYVDRVETFFRWIDGVSFYELNYSNTPKALKIVEKLFDDE